MPVLQARRSDAEQLEEAFPGKLRFSFRQNPLPFHARALPAAIAAEEARAQGGDAKFWAMHDKLFELAPALDDASISAPRRSSASTSRR